MSDSTSQPIYETDKPTIIWCMLLCAAEGAVLKLPENHPAIPYAEQMQQALLLSCEGENEWILTSKGMDTLAALERLRDLSLTTLTSI